MCVYRVIENKRKPSPPVDEWTLHHRIREGKIQPQTLLDCDGQVLPAAQMPTLAPLFAQGVKPIAPYLQPSQAGYVSPDLAAHSFHVTRAQVMGLLVGVGCLILWFINLPRPDSKSGLSGQWKDVAVTGSQHTAQGKVNASR